MMLIVVLVIGLLEVSILFIAILAVTGLVQAVLAIVLQEVRDRRYGSPGSTVRQSMYANEHACLAAWQDCQWLTAQAFSAYGLTPSLTLSACLPYLS
jgi:hypothetical protein